jgi:general secretion pathway protein G
LQLFTLFKKRAVGLTLIELIVAITILMILTGAAVPIARVRIRRDKERELQRALWEMRDAIDRYKDAADRGAFQIKVGTEGYPPDLETLVKGIDSNGKKLRFLRRIPVDPMTGNTEWGMRSMQDEPDSDSWGGQNVFDVYTKAQGTGLGLATSQQIVFEHNGHLLVDSQPGKGSVFSVLLPI